MSTSVSLKSPEERTICRLKDLIQVAGFLLLLIGILTLVVAVHHNSRLQTQRSRSQFYATLHSSSGTVRHVLRFFVSIACIPIGLIGFFGAAMENRFLLVMFCGLLLAGAAATVSLVIYLSIYGDSKDAREAAVTMRHQIVRLYGNSEDRTMHRFTDDLDDFQRENQCCGWGDLDSSDSAFKRSRWANATAAAAANASLTGPASVPESCCTDRLSKCNRTLDAVADRRAGVIFAKDCSEQRAALYRKLFLTRVISLSILSALLACCAVAPIVLLMRLPRKLASQRSSENKSESVNPQP